MYSNFITPPDFVDDDFHTITCIDLSDDELLVIAKACQHAKQNYNVYLYRSGMSDDKWLTEALKRSKHILVNLSHKDNFDYASLENAYCYGHKAFLCPATFINNPLAYFEHVEINTK